MRSVFLAITVGLLILTVILLFVGLASKGEKQKILLTLTAISVAATLISLTAQIVLPPEPSPPPSSSSTATPPSPPETTPPPTTPPPSPPETTPPSTTPSPSPQSPYGQALQKEQLGQASYKDREKASIVTDTYFARSNSDGVHKSWYTSTRFEDADTGYMIGLYYADGLLFFAEAYHIGEGPDVTFYFWGDQMFACHDLVGGEDGLSYRGSSVYNRIVRQFGDIYTKSLQYAQYAK